MGICCQIFCKHNEKRIQFGGIDRSVPPNDHHYRLSIFLELVFVVINLFYSKILPQLTQFFSPSSDWWIPAALIAITTNRFYVIFKSEFPLNQWRNKYVRVFLLLLNFDSFNFLLCREIMIVITMCTFAMSREGSVFVNVCISIG